MTKDSSNNLFKNLATFFGGKKSGVGKKVGTTRIFFATDIHGSDLCFRLFLNSARFYECDVLIMGGDVTGKFLVLIRHHNGRYQAKYKGAALEFSSLKDAQTFERSVALDGGYGFICNDEEYDHFSSDAAAKENLFRELIEKRIAEWVELADTKMKGSGCRIFFNGGNDDIFSIDRIIDQSETMVRPEGKILEIDGHLQMISTGFTNETPFHCPRDIPEAKLRRKIDAMAGQITDFSKCIFNFHCPPHGTVLDRAPKIDDSLRPKMTGFGIEECSAGSTAVREAIVEYQPCLALHGHIHESAGAVHLGKSLCINPGSEYGERVLRSVIVDFHDGILQRHMFKRVEAG